MKHCEDHSGFVMWQRGVVALLAYAAALLSFSVFWQAPSIRQDVNNHINDNRLKAQETDIKIKDLEKRTDVVESQLKKLMASR